MGRVSFFALLAVASVAVSVLAGPEVVRLVLAHTGGPLVFAGAVFLLLLVGVVPGALVGIAAGALFGIGGGFALAGAAVLAAAWVAFALSRSFLRPFIAAALQRSGVLARLDAALTEENWRLVALLRVSPVMPFSLTSYALGLSGISFGGYSFGTLASLPPLLGYVVMGALGREGVNGGGALHVGLLGVGVVATLALTVHVTKLGARVLRGV